MNLPAELTQESSSGVITLDRATEVSQTALLPEHFHKNPANVQYAMELGHSLGVNPVAALRHIHVFPDKNNLLKAGLSADLMVTLARNAGHIVQLEGTMAKATATLIRGDSIVGRLLKGQIPGSEMELVEKTFELVKEIGLDPKSMGVFTESFSTDRANSIGLANKTVWQHYGPEMCKARAKANCVRSGASEVLVGLQYTPEELGADVDAAGVPLVTSMGRPDNTPVAAVSSTPETPVPATESFVPQPILDFVKSSSLKDIVTTAKDQAGGSQDSKTKFRNLSYLIEGCRLQGRANEEISIKGNLVTLNDVLHRFQKDLIQNS